MSTAFWALAAGRFVSALGDGFFFPFIAMFLQQVHGLAPSQVGLIMTTAGLCSLVARLPAGWLTDRWGFKPVVVAGLAGAGVAVMLAGWAPGPWAFAFCYAVMSAMVWGSFPALLHGAGLMVPPRRREEAYSILNLLSNAAIAIGPVLGAYVVERDIRLIFLLDGLSFLTFAAIVARWVPALREPGLRVAQGEGQGRAVGDSIPSRTNAAAAGPAQRAAEPGGLGRRALRGILGFFPPLSHAAFWQLAAGALAMNLIYSQMGSSLPLDLNQRFGEATWYGWLWTLNGTMIATLQYPATRWLQRYSPRPRRVAAALLYATAALMILVAKPVVPFLLAFAVLTAGEIIFTPLLQASVAAMAPPGQGGRYQAAASLLFGMGWSLGPAVGGALLGAGGPRLLWPAMAGLGVAAAAVFALGALGAGGRAQRPGGATGAGEARD
ncbi:major facilitator superfamily MFS_1 [Thermaerobacter marianensis DSM 12885]|uniref:Major facilitator superfamily MFS_1 n=1 Tax=Thermaerobacter marianensis (strain ATCC 700841 / DSM 12885 / JCM 10246 / 7p75a) TaxID=644966 RepID=E6SGE5_THEM7|nr:MFS transporter [Thermaerobacter marianensis]ADU51597.1 major facilitator superfamily MFS_1 [Thermaerobacter marianensis DSM 12885]